MKTIAITLGDVAGIGPEVVRKALRSGKLDRRFRYQIILEKQAPRVAFGKSSPKAAQFALASLEAGVAGCLEKKYSALVTGPVNKAGLQGVGFRFPGQTEWLAHRTRTKDFAMMLAGKSMRVAIVTTHVPVRKVSSLLKVNGILNVIELTHRWLLKLGIRKPRIFVAAFNPHGGVDSENGLEERKIIIPAVRKARQKFGNGISGPHSPDALFWRLNRGEADAAIGMYHDQALIPFKMLAFEDGVNVTLGLPIIRTSPDHGTAYGIAGKNRANPQSMIEAINLAGKLIGK